MKRTTTTIHTSATIKSGVLPSQFFMVLSIVCCGLFSMTAVDMSAQAISTTAPADPISTEDYPGTKWMSPADYASVLSTEQSNTATKLANPNLGQVELGLYTGYARMITYMQDDLNNHSAIGEIAFKSYKRVVSETPADPILKHMYPKDFQILYDALLPKLIRS